MGRRSRERTAAVRTQPRASLVTNAADADRTGTPGRRQPAVAITLALLCIAAYANSFASGFALDNRQLILNDPRVHAWTSENLSLIWSHSYWWPYGESGLYRPLSTLTYLFNYAVLGNGVRPFGYHLVNVLLHITNVLLVWSLAERIARSRWIATASAAIWAVVPLSTEAVTNIVGRPDLLAATCSLAALLVYVTGRARPSVRSAMVALLIVAGVLSKESALAIVGTIVLYELLWWSPGRSVRMLGTTAAASAVVLLPWALQRATVLGSSKAAEFAFTDNPIVGAGFWQGRLTAVQVMWRYLALLAWPARLSNDYSYAQIPLAQGSVADWTGVLLLTCGVLLLLWQLRQNKPVMFFAGFAFLMFLPASNLLFATGTIMGERLVYLPSAGIAVLVAIGLQQLASRLSGVSGSSGTTDPAVVSGFGATAWLATLVVAVIVGAYAVRTIARNTDWKDDATLWRSATRAAPRSAKAHSGLADALYDADPSHANIDEVIEEADRAAALLDPVPNERNAFHVYRQAGAFYLDKANRVDGSAAPDAVNPALRRLYARAMNMLDRAVLIARAEANAIPAASQEPEADAQRLRAVALLALQNPAAALLAAERAKNLSPLQPLAYRTAASALLALKRDDEAVITLLTGSIVTADRSLGDAAVDLYRGGLDLDGCAISGSGAAAALNPRCPIVQRHSCAATADAVRIDMRIGRRDQADQLRASAVGQLGCPADLLDRAMRP